MYPSVDTNQLVAHGCSSLRFDVLGCLKENLQETPQNKRVVSCTLHVPLKLAQNHYINPAPQFGFWRVKVFVAKLPTCIGEIAHESYINIQIIINHYKSSQSLYQSSKNCARPAAVGNWSWPCQTAAPSPGSCLGVVLLPELGTVTKNNVPLVQIEKELKQDWNIVSTTSTRKPCENGRSS